MGALAVLGEGEPPRERDATGPRLSAGVRYLGCSHKGAGLR